MTHTNPYDHDDLQHVQGTVPYLCYQWLSSQRLKAQTIVHWMTSVLAKTSIVL